MDSLASRWDDGEEVFLGKMDGDQLSGDQKAGEGEMSELVEVKLEDTEKVNFWFW